MKVEVECPFCCGTMVLRRNKKNGNEFYGCKGYPNCKYTMSVRKYKYKEHLKGCSLIGEDPSGGDYDEWDSEF